MSRNGWFCAVRANLAGVFVTVLVMVFAPHIAAGAERHGRDTLKSTIEESVPNANMTSHSARVTHRLTPYDQVVALASIQIALTRVGDGGSYLWRRGHGKLAGFIQPTTSFKDNSGRVCRHVVVLLVSGGDRGRTEAVACRMSNGVWEIGG